ncbi:MAG TPA: hypothetical protein VFA93_01165 [Patescibacteria group bacterium]|nr:hypothetical protein [Patescibacteria group bacterium]
MQSILISSKNTEQGREEAEKILGEYKVSKFDVSIFESEKAIGIADVREIQRKLYLKPFKSEIKGILIDASSGITTESQNALLKTLEEAPEDTIIIMLTPNIEEMLPTIVSRCKILSLDSSEENKVEQRDLEILLSGKLSDKMKLAQDLSKDKNEALVFLESSIISFRKNLLNSPNEKFLKSVKILQKYYSIIKSTNVNLRLALENLFLNL